MKRTLSSARLLLALPLVASCSFILDFNELQRGNQNGSDAGTGGHAGSGGSTGKDGGGSGGVSTGGTSDASVSGGTTSMGGTSGGTGGAETGGTSSGGASTGGSGADASPCGNCDDGDPCTVDTCNAGACEHENQGAIADGLNAATSLASYHRVTMIYYNSRFYLSGLETTAGKLDLVFNDFGFTDKTLGLGATLSELAATSTTAPPGTAVSAAGMTLEKNDIAAYVAMGSGPGKAQVYRYVFAPGLLGGVKLSSSTAAAADTNYTGDLHSYPVAWVQGNTYSAWVGADGVYLQSGNVTVPTGATATFPSANPVLGVAPLGLNDTPGVAFLTANGLSTQALGQAAAASAGQCDDRAGTFTALTSASAATPNVWIAEYTKTLANGILTERAPVTCSLVNGTPSCKATATCSKNDSVLSGTRNPSLTYFSRASDPPTRFYVAQVAAVADNASGMENLELTVTQVDTGGDAGVVSTLVTPTPIIISQAPLNPGTGVGATPTATTPDWPAVSFGGADRLGIAWLQGTTTREDLHVARYKICYPQ
jgi:hypothetical protein